MERDTYTAYKTTPGAVTSLVYVSYCSRTGYNLDKHVKEAKDEPACQVLRPGLCINAHYSGIHVLISRGPKNSRYSDRFPACAGISTLVWRAYRIDLRRAGDGGFPDPMGGFPCQRRNGCGLFPVSLEVPVRPEVFSGYQQG